MFQYHKIAEKIQMRFTFFRKQLKTFRVPCKCDADAATAKEEGESSQKLFPRKSGKTSNVWKTKLLSFMGYYFFLRNFWEISVCLFCLPLTWLQHKRKQGHILCKQFRFGENTFTELAILFRKRDESSWRHHINKVDYFPFLEEYYLFPYLDTKSEKVFQRRFCSNREKGSVNAI